MKFIGFLISFLGALSLYLTHSNQNLLAQKLPTWFRFIGICALFIGLIVLLFSLPKLVAVLGWLILCIFVWSFFPFIALFKRSV